LPKHLGDPYRQLSNKKLWAWKFERWMIHGVLVFAIIMTVFTGYLTYNVIQNPTMESKEYLFGFSAYDVRELYGFLIGSIFAGVIGTGFYPIFGNRTWCQIRLPACCVHGLGATFQIAIQNYYQRWSMYFMR
jgi:ferredoxin-type protein NapH